jgi:hypothetical protein
MFKSSFGLAATAAVLLLGFSPKAREIARKYAVIGAEKLLDINDQLKAPLQKSKNN